MDQAPVYGWSLLEAINELFPDEPHLYVLAAGLSDDPTRATPPSPKLLKWQGVLWKSLSAPLRSGKLIARGARLGQPNKEAIPADFFDAATADFQAGTVTAHGLTFGSVRLFRPEPTPSSQVTAPALPSKRFNYADLDAPLVMEMQALIDSGAATGPMDAARAVADRAEGKGEPASKAKRLLRHFQQVSGHSGQN